MIQRLASSLAPRPAGRRSRRGVLRGLLAAGTVAATPGFPAARTSAQATGTPAPGVASPTAGGAVALEWLG